MNTCGSERCHFAKTFLSAIHGISAKRTNPFVPLESFLTLEFAVHVPSGPKLKSENLINSDRKMFSIKNSYILCIDAPQRSIHCRDVSILCQTQSHVDYIPIVVAVSL